MGVDCANIQHVIHMGPPANTESFIQDVLEGMEGMVIVVTDIIINYSVLVNN